MLKRTAESLFWIGRYMERAENHARLVDVYYHLQQEDIILSQYQTCKWVCVVEAIGHRAIFEQKYVDYKEANVLEYIILDRENPNSLVSCISQARNNLRTLREQVPTELWEVLNSCYLWLREQSLETIMNESPHKFLDHIKHWTTVFFGSVQSVMPRDNEWNILESGRLLERTENTLRIMQMADKELDVLGRNNLLAYPFLQAVLKSLSGYQSYRKLYMDRVNVESIMEFVLLNDKFPRSIHFTLNALLVHMKSIAFQDQKLTQAHGRILRQTGKIIAEIDCQDQASISAMSENHLVLELLKACHWIGEQFALTFFRRGEESA